MYRYSIFGVANKQMQSNCGKHFYVNVRREKQEARSQEREVGNQKSSSHGSLVQIRHSSNSSFKKSSFVKF